ncbi:MAG: pyruvate dehydrogenase [Oligoflexia bacterium]|nr:pyruvate dehydrogenase [Oligoflexia bacterium]
MRSDFDWQRVVYLSIASRAIDSIEETRLVPEKKVLYQFTARGHDVLQVMLGSLLQHPHDAVGAYYRSRPMLLTLGLSLEDAFAGPMGKSGGFSDGRDIGVVCNLPRRNGKGPVVLPMSGDVGSQYTPIAGWAQSILYFKKVLGDKSYERAMGVVLGGDASVATNGFWSSLTIATTLKLPMLFYIEDNGFGISVPSTFQTPGANIAKNLASFSNLKIFDGDGSRPAGAFELMSAAVSHVREHGSGPALLRLTVPRLSGHSGQDTQAYKSKELIEQERSRDPLKALKEFLVPKLVSDSDWSAIEARAHKDVDAALEAALARPEPSCNGVARFVYADEEIQQTGGLYASGYNPPASSATAQPEPTRINLVTAVRRTLESELKINPKVLVFGEDVGPKGGVHAVTLGLQDAFGADRVFDTSLSEEGIIGRAVGMAISGLLPVAEIQFRKYADPAHEQLNNCGTMRWRTVNRFAAPIVVRMPGGFAKCGDPWHSVSGEVLWAHAIGWQVCYPSNAEDAVGLLRTAMRSNNPTIFFEHRHLLDAAWARRPYPGDDFALPLGKAKQITEGTKVTVVSWGAMVERCDLAIQQSGVSAELLDLRTIMPWDKQAVLASVGRTRRILIVHEDGLCAGFGAEIAATVAKEAFFKLDCPVERMAVPDLPIPYNTTLMESVLPTVEGISAKLAEMLES